MSYHTPWDDAHATALTHHVLGGHLSYSGIAAAINVEFNTIYSRNACIGKAGRLGLINPYWQKLATMVKKPRKLQPYKPRPKRPLSAQSVEYVEFECSEIVPRNLTLLELEPNERVSELARMLGGQGSAVRKHAEALLSEIKS